MRKNLLSLGITAAIMLCGTVDSSLSFKSNPFTDFLKSSHAKLTNNISNNNQQTKAEAPSSQSVNAAQGCKDNIYKIASLPYWDPTQTLPCMYSGTF